MQTRTIAAFRTIANLRLRQSEDGQDLLEYGLLASLIALAAIAAVTAVGNTIHSVFWETIGAAL